MAQTVVGFFDELSNAQQAVDKLQSSGIDRDRVDVSPGNRNRNTTTTATQDNNDDESGITKFFKSLFGDDDDEARKYSTVGQSSNYIVTVHAQTADEAERAADILDDCDAVNVDERAAEHGLTGNSNETGITNKQDITIPVIEENVEIGKKTVERGGGVRVQSRIIERPVEEHLRLREEHVDVERTPVNRPVSADDMDTFREGTVEFKEHAEVPVVNKEARVVEEVRVKRDVEQHDETVRETVRKTDVDVERINRSENRDTTDSTGDTRSL